MFIHREATKPCTKITVLPHMEQLLITSLKTGQKHGRCLRISLSDAVQMASLSYLGQDPVKRQSSHIHPVCVRQGKGER